MVLWKGKTSREGGGQRSKVWIVTSSGGDAKCIHLLLCLHVSETLLSAPLNVTIREIEVNSAVVTWEILEGDPVIGFAITQQVQHLSLVKNVASIFKMRYFCLNPERAV